MAGSKNKSNKRRTRAVCWSRMSKKGRYVVCNKSRGQKSMRRRTSKRVRSKRNKSKRGRK